MKAMIVLNPHAHSGTTPALDQTQRDDISAQLKTRLELESVEWSETQHPGHGKALTADAISQGYENIFTGGADATIAKVLIEIITSSVAKNKTPILEVL